MQDEQQRPPRLPRQPTAHPAPASALRQPQ